MGKDDRECAGKVVVLNKFFETWRTRHIGALANIYEGRFTLDNIECFKAAKSLGRGSGWDGTWWEWRNFFNHSGDVLGCRAAATTDHVDETCFSKACNRAAGVFGCFVVAGLGKRVGQASVWIDMNVSVGYARQLLEEGLH